MRQVRRKVTMVFQNGALFDSVSVVGENVAFPLREREDLREDQIFQVVNGLLEMVGVAGMADLLPSDLSTGIKRSVAIAARWQRSLRRCSTTSRRRWWIR